MAKRRPLMSLAQMEDRLGYKLAPLDDVDRQRFYSDLITVPLDIYERTRDELNESLRAKGCEWLGSQLDKLLPEPGTAQTISSDQCTVIFERMNHISEYGLIADVQYDFGVHLTLQLTRSEALASMYTVKMPHGRMSDLMPRFVELPRELRDKIYTYAIPRTELHATSAGYANGFNLARGISDPSGFYFPFRTDLSILAVNKQVREETLVLAYRKTFIQLDDMDEFVKFAVSIGKVGRDNIESISFTWESRSDTECTENDGKNYEKGLIKLPKLHTMRCVQLLGQFKRLRFLRLHFEKDLISTLSTDDFRNDPGLCKLCSLQGIDRIEILDESGEALDRHKSLSWIKEEIESSRGSVVVGEPLIILPTSE